MNPKDRIGSNKADLSLIPPVAQIHAAHALMDGSKKYGRFNWRDEKIQASVYLSACKRHLDAWAEGEECAPDSTAHHLGHAIATLLILVDAMESGNLIDNRSKNPSYLRVVAKVTEKIKKTTGAK